MGDIKFTKYPLDYLPSLPNKIIINVLRVKFKPADWEICNDSGRQLVRFNFNETGKYRTHDHIAQISRDTNFDFERRRIGSKDKVQLFYRMVDKIAAACPECIFFRGKVNKTHHGVCSHCGKTVEKKEFCFQVIFEDKIVKKITRNKT
jgi:hypothetical protein